MLLLSEKADQLVKLSIQEGIDTITAVLNVDFKVKPSDMTVHQRERLNNIERLLYILFTDIVEDHGVLQTQYEV